MTSYLVPGRLGLMALSLLLVVVGGCASTKLEPYVPNPPQPLAAPIKLRVAVVELENQSPPREWLGMGSIIIPGVIYVNSQVQYTPTKFGACVASELQASKLFSKVTYFPTWSGESEPFQGYDVILSGSLNHDKRPDYETAWGFGFLATVPKLLMIPGNWEDREVSFELWAAKTQSPSHVIFLKKIEFKEPSKWHSIIGEAGCCISQGWHEGEGQVIRSPCPTELLQAPFLEVRQELFSAVQH